MGKPARVYRRLEAGCLIERVLNKVLRIALDFSKFTLRGFLRPAQGQQGRKKRHGQLNGDHSDTRDPSGG